MDKNKIKTGSKIKFKEEKAPYTVRAISNNYAILTKPYNPKRTVIYTIIDFNKNIRGTNNYVFNPFDYAKAKDIKSCIAELEAGICDISRRNNIFLNIDYIN